MKKLVVFAVALAVIGCASMALAADAPKAAPAAPAAAAPAAPAAPAPAAPAAPVAKAEAKPAPAAKEMAVDITGKVEVKDKVALLTVAECKCAADKDKACAGCAAMKGKSLKIGAKAADAEKLAGKNVVVKGTVKGDTIDLASIAEKK